MSNNFKPDQDWEFVQVDHARQTDGISWFEIVTHVIPVIKSLKEEKTSIETSNTT